MIRPYQRVIKKHPTKIHDELLSWHKSDSKPQEIIVQSDTSSDPTISHPIPSHNTYKKKKKKKGASRPASLLVSENGFVRVRQDGELGGDPVMLSTDDELEEPNASFNHAWVNNKKDEHLYSVIQESWTPASLRHHDVTASMLSYRVPSSIHLRDSIDNALDMEGFTIRTPDVLNSNESLSDFMSKKRDHSCSVSHVNDTSIYYDIQNVSYDTHSTSYDRQSVLTAATSLLDSSRSTDPVYSNAYNSTAYNSTASTLPIRARYRSNSLVSEKSLITRSQSFGDPAVWLSMESQLNSRGRTIFHDLISDINRMCKGISAMSPQHEEQSTV